MCNIPEEVTSVHGLATNFQCY